MTPFPKALHLLTGQLFFLTATIVSFHRTEPLAAALLTPVWLVTLFAVFLTFSIFKLNPQVHPPFPLSEDLVDPDIGSSEYLPLLPHCQS